MRAEAPVDCAPEQAAPLELDALESLESASEKRPTVALKNWSELDAYFTCHMVEKKRLTADQRKAIKLAANHYGIPEALLACYLFLENRFRSTGASGEGAVGFAQIMPNTLETIRILNSGPSKKVIKLCWETKVLTQKNLKYCFGIQKLQAVATSWDRLSQTFKEEGLIKAKRIPFNSESSISSIAMSAMYYSHFYKQIEEAMRGRIKSSADQLNLYKIALVAYNRGPDLVATRIEEMGGSPKPGALLKNITDNSEAKNYAAGIGRCMEPGNFIGPSKKEAEEEVQCKK